MCGNDEQSTILILFPSASTTIRGPSSMVSTLLSFLHFHFFLPSLSTHLRGLMNMSTAFLSTSQPFTSFEVSFFSYFLFIILSPH